jgi:hypothetical protein
MDGKQAGTRKKKSNRKFRECNGRWSKITLLLFGTVDRCDAICVRARYYRIECA